MPNAFNVPPRADPFPPGTHLLRDAAQIFFKPLREHIVSLEDSLGENEELAFIHAQSGEAIIVERVAYVNPSAIVIYGRDADGRRASVFAHLNSFQIMFKVVDAGSDLPRKPIGFATG